MCHNPLYPSDLSDAEWAVLASLLPPVPRRSRPRLCAARHVLDAVFYVLRSGCAWRLLPREYPPWRAVYYWFRKWHTNGTFERLNSALRERYTRSEEHTSELQSRQYLVCRLMLEKKKINHNK